MVLVVEAVRADPVARAVRAVVAPIVSIPVVTTVIRRASAIRVGSVVRVASTILAVALTLVDIRVRITILRKASAATDGSAKMVASNK